MSLVKCKKLSLREKDCYLRGNGLFFCLLSIMKKIKLLLYSIKREAIMEIYLLITLVLVYILTIFLIKKHSRQRLWLAAFIIAFIITGIALSFLRFTNQDIMMNAAELSWYYILYLFASIMVALGIINLWVFRHSIWNVLFSNKDD